MEATLNGKRTILARLCFEAPFEFRVELIGKEVKRLAESFKLHSPGMRENIIGTIGLTPQGALSIHMELP